MKSLHMLEVRNSILDSQIKEQIRIGSDLHDQLGPMLSAVKMYAEASGQSDKEPLLKIKQMISQALKDMRNIYRNLTFNNLDRDPFDSVIRSHIDLLNPSRPIAFDILLHPEVNYQTLQIKIQLLRIITELIENSIKYSNCDSIIIHISTLTDGRLLFTYKDNGRSSSFNPEPGIGLKNIKSRFEFLNGEIIQFSHTFENGAAYIVKF
jgi:signal transduction histidine kinase